MRVKNNERELALFHAVIETIYTHGFEQISLSKLSRESGIPKASFYTYFSNKEDMLNKVYILAKKEYTDEVFADFYEGMDVTEAISIFMNNTYNYYHEKYKVLSFVEQAYNAPSIKKESKEAGLAYFKPLMDIYQRGKEEGTLKNYPLQLFKVFVFDTIINVVKMSLNKEMEVNDEIVNYTVQSALQAIVN